MADDPEPFPPQPPQQLLAIEDLPAIEEDEAGEEEVAPAHYEDTWYDSEQHQHNGWDRYYTYEQQQQQQQ
eukprot:436096-Alexandrium_andersonii.AAC.1